MLACMWQVRASADCHLVPVRASLQRAEDARGSSRCHDVRGSQPRGRLTYGLHMPGLQVSLWPAYTTVLVQLRVSRGSNGELLESSFEFDRCRIFYLEACASAVVKALC
jgi:hypothetical protein